MLHVVLRQQLGCGTGRQYKACCLALPSRLASCGCPYPSHMALNPNAPRSLSMLHPAEAFPFSRQIQAALPHYTRCAGKGRQQLTGIS